MGNETPGPQSALATAEPWDLVAAAYAEDALPYFQSFSREALRVAELPPDPRIADVACGPGTLSLLAAAAGARVSAIDISPGMVEAFRARARRRACPVRSTFTSAMASSYRSRPAHMTARSRCSA